MKKCIKCGAEKPDECFHRQIGARGGRRGACASCVRAYKEMKVRENPDYFNSASRKWHRNNKEKHSEIQKKWNASHPEAIMACAKRYRENNPDKVKCRNKTKIAIRRGDITTGPCQRCGSVYRVHGHHEDYSRPLDITWLCGPCHCERHMEINEERRNKLTVSGD